MPRKSAVFELRLDPRDKGLLHRAAQRAGLGMSELVREASLGAALAVLLPPKAPEPDRPA
jgi:uncharacterized protein (DUF1778 family)